MNKSFHGQIILGNVVNNICLLNITMHVSSLKTARSPAIFNFVLPTMLCKILCPCPHDSVFFFFHYHQLMSCNTRVLLLLREGNADLIDFQTKALSPPEECRLVEGRVCICNFFYPIPSQCQAQHLTTHPNGSCCLDDQLGVAISGLSLHLWSPRKAANAIRH